MESLFNSEDFTVRESPFSSIADAHTYSSLTENPNINGEHIIQRENTSYERGMDFTALDVQEILDDPQILTNEFLMNFSEEDFMDDYSSEGSQEEFEALHQDEIRRVSGLGKRKHKLFRGRTSGPNEQPEVARYLQLANGYYISKQFDNAIEACEAAIQLQPRADKAYSLLGVMAEERGDMRRALSMYLFMAHIVPREADLWRRLAVFAKLHGSPEEIVVCLRKAMFANQKDTLPAWQLIQHFEQTGESNSQIDTYRQILKHVPYNMHLIRDLVVLFLKKNRYRDACQWIYDALVFHSKGLFNTPWVPPAESLLQDQILREGNVFSSLLERISFSTYYIQDLNSLPLTESTGCASIQDLYLSTYLSIKEGRYSSCLILVKRYFLFLQGKPVDSNDEEIEAMDDSNCLGDIATFMKRGHDFDKSSEILTDFHTIPEVARYLQLANGYYISKQFDNAIEACEAAIQLQPRADKAYSLLGVMAEERGDMRRALSMYLFMAHIVPREADLWRRLAVFAKLHGSPEEIVVCLRKAMFANQKDTLPAWQLIQHFEQTGESNSQIDTYRQILKHVPYNMHLIRDLVVLFLKKNRYRDACQWIYDALVFHSKGLFNTPWVPPAESLLQDQILREGNVFSSLLERISFSTYYIQDLNSLPLTESTGCASIQDLYLSTYLSIKEGRYSSCLILVKRYFLFLQGKPVDSNDEEIEAMDDSNCLGDIATFMKRGHDFDKSSEILTDFHTIPEVARYLQLANGYYISKQFDNAIEACEAAIQLQPHD
ncbi:transcription factor TFIIIC subunit tfc4 [Coelomomyces lativittatus]|nr:transcription factor TFIIIC subunit tfc4 [Coelomomyces lativittatus]